jgi:2-polyprenyl-6-methoxyphenol hydroxylase-like FAD-dependent oxidoreductase
VSGDVIVIGAGIGGLTFALALHKAGVPCRIFEGVAELKPLGVGLNLLPHAMRDLAGLGVDEHIMQKGVPTREYCFFTRYGQLVYREPRGLFAGYQWPQVSIHRADLHAILLEAVRRRLGAAAVSLGHRCTGVEQDADSPTAHFADAAGRRLASVRGSVAVACEGD